MSKESVTRVFKPNELFSMLGVKEEDTEQAEKIFKFAYDFLNYMAVGDELRTTNVTYKKIAADNIHVDAGVDMADSIDTLNKKRIIVIGY